MTNPISIRLKEKDQEKIMQIVEEEGTTISSTIAKVVHEWICFGRVKDFRGDITLASQILRTRHNAIKQTEISEIVRTDAKFILEEMEYQVDDLSFWEVSKRIREWNKENNLSLVVVEREEHVIFKQRHMLGAIWSEIQCKMYAEIFKGIGEIVRDLKYTKNSFSFKVIRRLE